MQMRKDLAFLNYDIIPQEQVPDIYNDESFANADVSAPSDSSEEETQEWRSVVRQFWSGNESSQRNVCMARK